ncbi:MAG TPA: hypothetical protein VH458_10850 [Vicinamibacterales bacterium]|jgi:hypothetical protein
MTRAGIRILAIGTVVVLIPLALHGVWDQIEATRLSRRVREIQQRGEPVNTAENRRPLDSEQQRDASRLYFAAAILSVPTFPPRLQAASTGQALRGSMATLAELAGRPAADVRRDPRLADLEATVESVRSALSLLDEATPLDFQRFSPDSPAYSLLTSDLIRLATVNSLRTSVLALRGDIDQAASSHVASVRLLRTFTGMAGSFTPRTTDALALLIARGSPDESALRTLQQAYAHAAENDGLADALIDRRATMLESAWPHSYGRASWVQRLAINGLRRRGFDPVWFLLRPWLTRSFIAMIDTLQAEIAIARQPWPQKYEAVNRLRQQFPEGPRQPFGSTDVNRFGVPLQFPAPQWSQGFVRYATAAGERLAVNRAAVAVLGVELFRRTHGGTLPQMLDGGVLDPFTGRPLKYVRSDTSYTVYSVGPDQHDDGGEVGEGRGARDRGIRVRLGP